jgi:hypothetical protein
MNKQGTGMNMLVKGLLIIAGLVTIFSGVNELWISTGRESLVRVISSNSGLMMKIVYAIMGVGSLVTSVMLAIKVFRD